MTLTRLQALMLLSQCTGVDIWPVEVCRRQGVPEAWIEELADCHESGFRDDAETVYFEEQVVNQFHGVHDLRLAHQLAAYLGVDTRRAVALAPTRQAEVRALKEAVEEL